MYNNLPDYQKRFIKNILFFILIIIASIIVYRTPNIGELLKEIFNEVKNQNNG